MQTHHHCRLPPPAVPVPRGPYVLRSPLPSPTQALQPGDVVLEVPLRLALTDHPGDEESNALLYEVGRSQGRCSLCFVVPSMVLRGIVVRR